MTLVAVAVAVNDHVNDHVIGRERKTHLNQKGHAGAFGASAFRHESYGSEVRSGPLARPTSRRGTTAWEWGPDGSAGGARAARAALGNKRS